MPREITDNNYNTKLLKLVPADFIAGFLAVDAAIPPGPYRKIGLTVATVLIFVLLFATLRFLHRINNWPQIIVTCISFIIWIYSIGGPFKEWNYYFGWLASVLLILWTFAAPLLQFKTEE